MRSIKVYDSKLKKKVVFEPIQKGEVSFYLCGPTVYDLAHLGHGRSAVAFDVIRKYFEYAGYNVNFVSNFTDIDDKMIKRAKEEGISVAELADKIIPEYEKDYDSLGIKRPSEVPRATSCVSDMIDIINKLEGGGFTYTLKDGVYFDVEKYSEYGALSGQKLEELRVGARVDVNEEKRNPYDFVLWKFKKEGEPSWESPWGEGRPGWHIECSAMSAKLLGETFDIHGGGRDLLFPHHECEAAQSVCANGPGTFAKHWIHNGFINVDDEKMSKSLNNFFTLRDVFEKYDPKVVRFMFLQTQYRNPINFSDKLLDQAKAGLERIHEFVRKLDFGKVDDSKDEPYEDIYLKEIDDCREKFDSSMDDDFNTSSALDFSMLKGVVMEAEARGVRTRAFLDKVKAFVADIDQVLGVIIPDETDLDSDIEALIAEREEARKNKDFATSDRIRDELKDRGIDLDDTPDGTIWKKV
jgi:cysteinyl-tRNA synthetase